LNFRVIAAPPGAQPGSTINKTHSREGKTMNALTKHEPGSRDDDGFSGSSNSYRVSRGSYLKWNDNQHWRDRDGMVPPSPLLVVAVNEILQRWADNKSTVITDKPLPDPEELNAAIPIKEWEAGVDGKPRKPWAHVVVVYFVNLSNGSVYTFSSPTVGGHIAYDHLREAVITMRALRGTKCMPVVNLTERPMKTNFGTRSRPHFEIIDWKTPGGEAESVPAPSPTPQLTAPAAAPTPTPTTASSGAKPRQAKPPVQLSEYTLAVMSDVKKPTTEELLNDSLDDLLWDNGAA
jgi:hypothetical protein